MLPDAGTREREQIEEEAIKVGIEALHKSDGDLLTSLYEVYNHFRMKFLAERGRKEQDTRVEALMDARQLEWHVAQVWATAIAHAHTLRKSLT